MWNNNVRLPPRLSCARPPRVFASSLRVFSISALIILTFSGRLPLEQKVPKIRRKKKKIDECSFSFRRGSPLSLSPAVSDSLTHSYSFIQSRPPLHFQFLSPFSPSFSGSLFFLEVFCSCRPSAGALNGSRERSPRAAADTRTHVTY